MPDEEVDYSFQIAEKLHDLFCRYNHTDQCGWLYELSDTFPGGTWNSWTHERYHIKALRILENNPAVGPEFINLVLDMLMEDESNK